VSQRAGSQQASLDAFFGALSDTSALVRQVSDRAFAKARARLHMPALQWLNQHLVRAAEPLGFVPRWHGLRLVAADASVLRPALRPCHRTVSSADADQRLFALFLPGAELTLWANVHSAKESERAMLVAALEQLGPDDVLLLDRGYPAAWLVQLLSERGIRFVMRCDMGSGWPVVREFMRGSLPEAQVQLNRPSAQDEADWGCQRTAPCVRLVRNVAPSGAVRVLATNLDAAEVPAAAFAELYHQRWRIEEAFKRLKHRLLLESVSGLSQQALIIDVAAKVLADNLASLMCQAAAKTARLDARQRKCKRSYAAVFLQRLLPRALLHAQALGELVRHALQQLAANTQRFIPGRSRPRRPQHVKPHPSQVYKG